MATGNPKPRKPTPPTPPIFVKGRKGARRCLTSWYDAGGVRRSHSIREPDGTCPKTPQRARLLWEAWKRKRWEQKSAVQNPAAEVMTVRRFCWRYLLRCHRYYRKRGEATSTVDIAKQAMRAMRDLFGPEPLEDFDAPRMARLRDSMIRDADGTPRAASTVNAYLRMIRLGLAWAREQGWVSAVAAQDIAAVKGVRAGRGGAKRKRKVKAVKRDVVDATVAQMPDVLRDMVELLWWSGMRPGEVCDLRSQDIQTIEGDWLYIPEFFKTDWQEDPKQRVVAIGPHARAIIERYMQPNLSAPLFSPAEAKAQRLAARRKARKTKLWPSHAKRLKADPVADIGEKYETETLRRAIQYACRRAGIAEWVPNQIRHATATRIEKAIGKDAARAVLGHTTLTTTEIYLDPDVQKAIRAAREVG